MYMAWAKSSPCPISVFLNSICADPELWGIPESMSIISRLGFRLQFCCINWVTWAFTHLGLMSASSSIEGFDFPPLFPHLSMLLSHQLFSILSYINTHCTAGHHLKAQGQNSKKDAISSPWAFAKEYKWEKPHFSTISHPLSESKMTILAGQINTVHSF